MRIGNDTLLETDLYDGEIINYTDTRQDGSPLMTTPFSPDDEPKPQWRLTIELTTEGLEGVTLPAFVTKPYDPDRISPKAKLVQIARAVLTEAEAAGEWGLDDLLHRPVRVQVEQYTKQDGTDANKITKFLPPKKAGARAATAPRAAPQPAPVKQEAVPF